MSADDPTWWSNGSDGEAPEVTPLDDGTTSAVDTPGPLGRKRKIITVTAVAAGIALTGGVALAAASGGSSSKTASGPGGGGPGGGFGGPPGQSNAEGGTTNGFGGGGQAPGGGAPPSMGTGTQQQGTPAQGYGSSGSTGSTQGGPGGGAGGLGGGFGGPGRGAGAAIHGEYVVDSGNGTYTTELTQRGTVSAVSSTSITVKSADGFSKTYVVPSTISVTSLQSGDTVNVIATLKDDVATATAIRSGSFTPGGTNGSGQPPTGGAQPSTTT